MFSSEWRWWTVREIERSEQSLHRAKLAKILPAFLEKLDVGRDRVLLVLNRTSSGGPTTEHVSAFFGRQLDAVIPFAPHFADAADTGRPIMASNPESPGSLEIQELATKLASLTPAAPRGPALNATATRALA